MLGRGPRSPTLEAHAPSPSAQPASSARASPPSRNAFPGREEFDPQASPPRAQAPQAAAAPAPPPPGRPRESPPPVMGDPRKIRTPHHSGQSSAGPNQEDPRQGPVAASAIYGSHDRMRATDTLTRSARAGPLNATGSHHTVTPTKQECGTEKAEPQAASLSPPLAQAPQAPQLPQGPLPPPRQGGAAKEG